MAQKPKNWFDDWELTVGSSRPDLEHGIEFVDVTLPNAHYPLPMHVRIGCRTPEENRILGILLDALLCELTGTTLGVPEVKELGNGADEPVR